VATVCVVAGHAELVADGQPRLFARSRRISTHYEKAKLKISIESIANSPDVEISGYQLELV
jgi:hypothetical protein